MMQLECLKCGALVHEENQFCDTCEYPLDIEKIKDRRTSRVQSIVIVIFFFIVAIVTIFAFVLVVVGTAIVARDIVQGMMT